MNRKITIAVNQRPCNKRVVLDKAGKPENAKTATVYDAGACTAIAETAAQLAERIKTASKDPKSVAIAGYINDMLPEVGYRLLSRRKMKELVPGCNPEAGGQQLVDDKPAWCRIDVNFTLSDWVLLEHDAGDFDNHVEWWGALVKAHPALADAPRVIYASNSSRVRFRDKPFKTGRYHAWVLLDNNGRAERLRYRGALLAAAGGQALFDPSTWNNANRLINCGAPRVRGEGLTVAPLELLEVTEGTPVPTATLEGGDTVTATSRAQPGAPITGGADHPDPVMAWLIDAGKVRTPGKELGVYGIVCPWEDHEPGGDTSTVYSPLCETGDPTKNLRRAERWFKCSHETCRHRSTMDFLQRIEVRNRRGGVFMPSDPVPYLEWRYGLIEKNNRVIDLNAIEDDWSVWCLSEFGSRYAPLHVAFGDQLVSAVKLWGASPRVLRLRGKVFAPDKARPHYIEHGHHFVNSYRPPIFQKTSAEPAAFLAHLEYLLPDQAEREHVLNWLASKVQHPDRRHPALLWVADGGLEGDTFGLGRGTMGPMLHRLFRYVIELEWAEFAGISSQGAFDAWRGRNLLAIIDEAKETTHDHHQKTAAYETIKMRVDTRVQHGVQLKEKCGPMQIASIFCDSWIYSNHLKPFSIPPSDRRITVLTCTKKRAEDSYFDGLADRLEAETPAVFHYLMKRDISQFRHTKPMDTPGKALMAELSESVVTQIVKTVVEKAPGDIMTREQWQQAVMHEQSGFELSMAQFDKLKKAFADAFVSLPTLDPKNRNKQIKIDGKPERPRILKRVDHWQEAAAMKAFDLIRAQIGKNGKHSTLNAGFGGLPPSAK